MPIRGQVHVNEPAKPYRYRLVPASTVSGLGFAINATDSLTKRWGNAYSAGSHGWKITLTRASDGAGTYLSTFTFVTPWGTFSDSSAVYATSGYSRVEIDGERLRTWKVGSICHWEYSFTELRWYVDYGSGEVLEQTISAQTETGTNFDLRKNTVTPYSVSNNTLDPSPCVDSAVPAPLSCGDTFGAFTPYDYSVSCESTSGWQYHNGTTWVSDTVQIKTQNYPVSTCACIAPSPGVSEVDSYEIVIHSAWQDLMTKTGIGETTATCDGGYQQVYDWKKTRTFLYYSAELNSAPDTSQMFDHNETAIITCSSDSDTLINNTTETVTYCELDLDSHKSERVTHCRDIIDAVPCIPPGTITLPTYIDTHCCTNKSYSLTWSTLPPCSWPLGVHLTRGDLGLMFACATRDSGIYLWRFDFNGLDEEFPVLEEVGIVSAQVAYHPNGQLLVAFEQDGDVKITRSYSWGEEWTVPEVIAAGTEPAPAIDQRLKVEYLAMYQTDRYRLYRKIEDGGAWSLMTPEIVIADEGRAGLEVSGDTLNRLVFVLDDGESIRRFVNTGSGEVAWVEE